MNFASVVIALRNKPLFGSQDFWHAVCTESKCQTTLPVTKGKTMFFNKTQTRRKTTRQTLTTEQLEPKAMFSATALPAVEPTASDQLDVGPVNRAAEVNQVNSYCTGYCVAGASGFIKLGDIKGEFRPAQTLSGTAGPGGSSFLRGVDILAQANQQPNLMAIRDADVASESLGGSADPGGDDIFMPKPNRIGGSASPGGDNVFMPKPNRLSGSAGPGGTSFFTGVNSLAQANQQPQIASVWTNGNATSMAPRHAAFASMGR